MSFIYYFFTGLHWLATLHLVTQLHWRLPTASSLWSFCTWMWSWNSAAETCTQSTSSSCQPLWLWSYPARDCLSYCRPVLAFATSAGRQCREWHAVVHLAIICHK